MRAKRPPGKGKGRGPAPKPLKTPRGGSSPAATGGSRGTSDQVDRETVPLQDSGSPGQPRLSRVVSWRIWWPRRPRVPRMAEECRRQRPSWTGISTRQCSCSSGARRSSSLSVSRMELGSVPLHRCASPTRAAARTRDGRGWLAGGLHGDSRETVGGGRARQRRQNEHALVGPERDCEGCLGR